MLALLLGIVACLVLVPEAPRVAHAHEHRSFAHVVRQPQVVALIVACALMAVAHGPYYTFIRFIWSITATASPRWGWLWGIGVICEIAIFFWMSHLFRTFTLRPRADREPLRSPRCAFGIVAWFAD
jgi:PPP family 3-phenylpropionic acid transporter